MDVILINALTIGAAFSQSIVLAVTLFVFFKNLKAMKQHNEITTERFEIQSKIEKFTLTLKFAEWVKNELNDYLPYINSKEKNAFLSADEIKFHFESITKNIIILIDKQILYKSLLLDEMKKLLIVVKSFSKDKEMIGHLERFLKEKKYWYEEDYNKL